MTRRQITAQVAIIGLAILVVIPYAVTYLRVWP